MSQQEAAELTARQQEIYEGVLRGKREVVSEGVAAELPGDKEILIYCANGIRAEMAHETLGKMGIRNRFLNETITIDKQGNYKL